MSNMPGFKAAEWAWENADPYAEDEMCDDGSCDTCLNCLADEAEAQAEAYAEGHWEDMRLEGKNR
jgi:hypothetical protein